MIEPAAREELIRDLLVRTSRTFALAIPQLPSPTDWSVTLAYLLFRIADTFEDATVLWTQAERVRALGEFDALLATPRTDLAGQLADNWLQRPPADHEGYVDLVRHTPEVFEELLGLPEPSRRVVVHHTRRTASGMADFVRKSPEVGELELEDLEELHRYCYVVAGIVGEMLTDLFLLDFEILQPVADELRDRASAFGEGLQLVNILKDSSQDHAEGRSFLPQSVSRDEVFALARADLSRASEYCRLLQETGAPHGVTAFTASPVKLAQAALDRVEERGPGAKLTRVEVMSLHGAVKLALKLGKPVL